MSDNKFKILGLDHIAIASDNPQKTQFFFEKHLGLKFTEREFIARENLAVSCGNLNKIDSQLKSKIEILFPTEDNKSIRRYIEKKGSGIHHMALRVDKIQVVYDSLYRAGIRLLSEKIQSGQGGTKIFFIHPQETGGILLELVEYS
jgi:LAO/AO transport system kinase